MSFKTQFFNNLLVTGGFSYAAKFVSFLGSIITARLLLPESYGLVGLITVFSGFITNFSDSGISMAVVRSEYGNSYYRGLNNLSVIIGVLLCIVMLFLIYPISIFFQNKKIIFPGIVISFLFLINSINIVPLAILQKNLKFNTLGRITFFSALINSFVTIILAFIGLEYWALILPQFATAFFVYPYCTKRANLKFSICRRVNTYKSYLLTKKLIGNLLGFNIINYWARNADNLVVGKKFNASDLGIYNRAYSLLLLPLSLITSIFSSVLYPVLVKHKKEGGSVHKEYLFTLKIISLLNIPIAIIFILYPFEFINTIWGSNWISVSELLPYFGLLVMTQTVLSTAGSIQILEGKERTMMIVGWISAFFMISGIILGSFISLEGIAAFYALFYIVFVITFYMYFVYYKSLGFPLLQMIWFWLPKVILSVLIWIGIYFRQTQITKAGVTIWILMVLLDTRSEIKSVFTLVINKYLNRSTIKR